MEWSIHEASTYIYLNTGITGYLVLAGTVIVRSPVDTYVQFNTEYLLVLSTSQDGPLRGSF